MISILFFVFLCGLFYSIGLPLRRMLTGFEWERSIIVSSSFGLALASLAVTLGYKLGLSPQLMFWLLIAFGLLSLCSEFFARRFWITPAARTPKTYILIGVLTAGLMLAPMLTGGINFALFQGNHIDAFNYLQSSITYTKWSYNQVHGATPTQLLDAGLFPFAVTNLSIRPTVAILYAVLSNFATTLFLGLNYIMLVYFQFLSVGILWLIAKELVADRPWQTLLLCVLIVGGFWGQYILDINAWSQEAALPLLLMVLLILFRSFSQVPLSPGSGFWLPTAFVIVLMGAFYLYPEATIFYLPGIVVAFAAGFWKTRKIVKIGPLIPAVAVTIVLLIAVKENNVEFLQRQADVALTDVNWWKYFDLCFFGRDGITPMPGADVVDVGTVLLGGYMITPYAHAARLLALVWRGALAAMLVLAIMNFLRGFKHLASPGREMLCSAVAVFILQTVMLLLLHKYWTAGKALSYFAFLLILIVFCPLCAADLRGGVLRNWSAVACAVLLVAQGSMLIYRPVAAKKRPFGHYHPPYPSAASDLYMRKRFNFSDWTVLSEIGAQDEVRIDIEDPFIQYFVKMLLLSNNRRFIVAPPVYENAYPLVVSPSAKDPKDYTCRLYVEEVHTPALKQSLKLSK